MNELDRMGIYKIVNTVTNDFYDKQDYNMLESRNREEEV